ncbi:hypothetical protein ACFSHQ_05120 [Gemmobacter lanyuensis]
MIGPYVTLWPGQDVPQRAGAVLLFVNAPDGGAISRAQFDRALDLGFAVWVIAGSLQVQGRNRSSCTVHWPAPGSFWLRIWPKTPRALCPTGAR